MLESQHDLVTQLHAAAGFILVGHENFLLWDIHELTVTALRPLEDYLFLPTNTTFEAA